MNNEQDLVKNFIRNYIPKISNTPRQINISKSNVYSKSQADLQFTANYNNQLIEFNAEVKTSMSSNKYNNAYMFYGNILNIRSLSPPGINRSYSAFFSYTNKDPFFINKILKITSNDWDRFGLDYNCLLIFFYDDTNNELYYSRWNGFISRRGALQKW